MGFTGRKHRRFYTRVFRLTRTVQPRANYKTWRTRRQIRGSRGEELTVTWLPVTSILASARLNGLRITETVASDIARLALGARRDS